MKSMKKILALTLAMLLLLSMAACSGSKPAEASKATEAPAANSNTGSSEKKAEAPKATTMNVYEHPVIKDSLKVGYMVQSKNSEATHRSLNQAAIEAAHRGWELVEVVYEEDNNFRDTFQNLVNQGVDAIIVGSGSSQEAKADLFRSARQAGIGVYCNDNQVVDGIISNCTMPNGVAGMQLLYRIGEDYSWDLNICVIEGRNQQLMIERCDPAIALIESGAYPNLKLLSVQDWTASGLSAAQSCYEIAQAWIQKYGEELDLIFTGADTFGVNSAEAVAQAGNDHIITCGIDGGNRAFAYLRNGTAFKYSYSQPFELYTHNVFEIIYAIQVKGLEPGDPGCPISKWGETVTFTGTITTAKDTLPIGAIIHEAFDYYDPTDTDAWYNWNDGPGVYTVQEWVKS